MAITTTRMIEVLAQGATAEVLAEFLVALLAPSPIRITAAEEDAAVMIVMAVGTAFMLAGAANRQWRLSQRQRQEEHNKQQCLDKEGRNVVENNVTDRKRKGRVSFSLQTKKEQHAYQNPQQGEGTVAANCYNDGNNCHYFSSSSSSSPYSSDGNCVAGTDEKSDISNGQEKKTTNTEAAIPVERTLHRQNVLLTMPTSVVADLGGGHFSEKMLRQRRRRVLQTRQRLIPTQQQSFVVIRKRRIIDYHRHSNSNNNNPLVVRQDCLCHNQHRHSRLLCSQPTATATTATATKFSLVNNKNTTPQTRGDRGPSSPLNTNNNIDVRVDFEKQKLHGGSNDPDSSSTSLSSLTSSDPALMEPQPISETTITDRNSHALSLSSLSSAVCIPTPEMTVTDHSSSSSSDAVASLPSISKTSFTQNNTNDKKWNIAANFTTMTTNTKRNRYSGYRRRMVTNG